jgi:hypothetical protein
VQLHVLKIFSKYRSLWQENLFVKFSQVGAHDKLGMQLVPLKLLKPYENKEFTLDLLKDVNINETPNKKFRGRIVVDLTFVPFKEDSMKFGGSSDGYVRKDSGIESVSDDEVQEGAGLLSVVIQEADEVEGDHHSNPYAVLTFKGERKRTKVQFPLQYIRDSKSILQNQFIQNYFLSPQNQTRTMLYICDLDTSLTLANVGYKLV